MWSVIQADLFWNHMVFNLTEEEEGVHFTKLPKIVRKGEV